MKKMSLLLIVSLLVLGSSCQTTWKPDSGYTNVPDPETVSKIAQLTLDLVALRNEYTLARNQQNIQKQMEILVLIMEKVQEIARINLK